MSTPSTGFSLPYQAIGQLVNLHHQAKESNYSLPHQSWAGPIQRITICAYRQFWQLTQTLRHNVQKMIVSFFLTKSRKYVKVEAMVSTCSLPSTAGSNTLRVARLRAPPGDAQRYH